MVTTILLTSIGDDSLFDSEPLNDRVKPTLKTSEQVRIEKNI